MVGQVGSVLRLYVELLDEVVHERVVHVGGRELEFLEVYLLDVIRLSHTNLRLVDVDGNLVGLLRTLRGHGALRVEHLLDDVFFSASAARSCTKRPSWFIRTRMF